MIDELALLVNDNFTKPLNQQIRDYSLMPMWLFTASTTFTPTKTGIYRIICVGAGGQGGSTISGGSGNKGGGGAGGIVIGIKSLNKDTSYNITVSNNASFGNLMTAYAGGNATYSREVIPGTGGSGSGDDCTIYPGNNGSTYKGGDVGIFSLGMVGFGGAGYSDSRSSGQGGGGGGFGGGGGGRYFYTGTGTSPKGGNGGNGFGGGRGASSNTPATTGGGDIDTTYNCGEGGSAAVFVEFISEE